MVNFINFGSLYLQIDWNYLDSDLLLSTSFLFVAALCSTFLYRVLNPILNDTRLFDFFNQDLHRANYKILLFDALHRCSRNLLVRHIYLLRRWLDFFYRPIHWIGILLAILVQKSIKNDCNCTSFLESLTLFVFQVPISSCLGF